MMRVALDGTATLRILDSKKEDAGSYSVTASNSAGESKSDCSVRVLGTDELPSEPKFVIPLRDVFVEMGAKAEMRVKVRGTPKPSLTWSAYIAEAYIAYTLFCVLIVHCKTDGMWYHDNFHFLVYTLFGWFKLIRSGPMYLDSPLSFLFLGGIALLAFTEYLRLSESDRRGILRGFESMYIYIYVHI